MYDAERARARTQLRVLETVFHDNVPTIRRPKFFTRVAADYH